MHRVMEAELGWHVRMVGADGRCHAAGGADVVGRVRHAAGVQEKFERRRNRSRKEFETREVAQTHSD